MFSLHPQLEQDSHLLGDFPLNRVLLINDCQYPWLVLVPRRDDVREIYQLNAADQQQLWRESSELGEQLMQVFGGDKLNIAALGNMVSQLHIHHIVRFAEDAAWPAPVWGASPMQAYPAEALQAFKAQFARCQFSQFDAAPCA